jgi:antitoxin VapB
VATGRARVYTFRIMTTAKVFKHGNSQAVRLPKEFRVEGDEVEVSRVGRVIILRPKRISYDDALAAVSRFKGTLRRAQDPDQERDWG